MNINTKNMITDKFEIDLNDFNTSAEFENYINNFLSSFVNNNSIVYPNIIHIEFNNRLSNISFIFVYPYIDRNISYEILFKDKILSNTNKLYLRISYIN